MLLPLLRSSLFHSRLQQQQVSSLMHSSDVNRCQCEHYAHIVCRQAVHRCMQASQFPPLPLHLGRRVMGMLLVSSAADS
jgi:hypothetical protein